MAKMKRAARGPFVAEGLTLHEARVSLDAQIDRALARRDEPQFVQAPDGRCALAWPTVGDHDARGWCVVQAGSPAHMAGEVRGLPGPATYGCTFTSEETPAAMRRSMRRSLADGMEDRSAACAWLRSHGDDEGVRALVSNEAFQIAYRRAAAKGADFTEAHRRACDEMHEASTLAEASVACGVQLVGV